MSSGASWGWPAYKSGTITSGRRNGFSSTSGLSIWRNSSTLSGPQFARRRGAASIAGPIILVMPIVRVLSYVVWPAWRTHLMMMGHTAIDAMMFGCLAAIWRDDRRFRVVIDRLFRWRAHVGALLFVTILSPFLQEWFRGVYGLTLCVSLEGICCTLVMLWTIEHSDSVVGRILNSRPFVHLGKISYSLYIWQQLFLAAKG